MESDLTVRAMDRIEQLLADGLKAHQSGAADVEHYINNARQIAAGVKALADRKGA